MAPNSISTDDRAEIAPSATTAAFDLHFFLTEAEWREATALLHPIVGTSYTKPWIRLFCAFCAIANLVIPVLNGWSWNDLIHYAPQRAAFTAVGTLLCAFGATGIGTKALDHRLNRLDLERHVVVTEKGVTIQWNDRTFNYEWKDFVFFRANANLVILRNPGIRFWTIPLRALPSGSESRFLDLLQNNVPRRQPYSWSRDSSGYAR